MSTSYSLPLVILSVAMAVIASYVALDLASRIAASRGTRAAKYWTAGGAVSMGIGIWSMHFIGMLALHMPIKMAYDIFLTILSLLIACLASALALVAANAPSLKVPRLLGAGTLMGLGIAAMHYVGMAAMQIQPAIGHDIPLVALSVFIAVAASVAALWLVFQLQGQTSRFAQARKFGAAMLMGLAIAGMHYTGMAAANFAPDSLCTVSGLEASNSWLGGAVGIFAALLLTGTLLISLLDVRLSERTAGLAEELRRRNVHLAHQAAETARANALLNKEIQGHASAQRALQESESRFRNAFDYAAIGMALVSTDGRWLQANRALCQITGYPEQELLALTFQAITHPDDLDTDLRHVQQMLEGAIQSYQMEKRYIHKTGRQVWVHLNVSLVRDDQGQPVHFISQIEDINARKEAELALRESEERFRSLTRLSADWFWEQDDQYRFTAQTGGGLNNMDITVGSMLGKTRWELEFVGVTEEMWTEHRAMLDAHLPFQDLEYCRVDEKGGLHEISVSGEPVFDAAGRFKGYRGIGREITKRKQVEAALQKSEESYRLLADNSSDMIVRLSPSGVVTYVSPASLIALGYRPDELVGLFVPDLVHPQEREAAGRLYGEVVRNNVPRRVTCRLRNKDASWHWMETSFRAVRDEDSTRTREVIGVSRNVDERVRVTEALNRFKYVLDHTRDMIYIYDVDSLRFTYVNQGAADALGRFVGDLLGQGFWDILVETTEAQFRQLTQPFLRGDVQSTQFETVVRTAEGNEIPVDCTMQLVRRTGESGMFVSILRDATERKKVDRLKNEFVSTVSHELRTPLTSIRGSLGLIAGGGAGPVPESINRLVCIAHTNSERLVRLVNDILDIEKIESGKMRFDMQPHPLPALLEQALDANRAYGDQLQVRFELRGPIPNMNLMVDSDRFMQVMANLLSNAVKFSPSPGVVDISAHGKGAGVRISITDHGSGIPEEFRAKIFGKFSQADSTNTRQKGGSGLGLSIAKAIVEKHGGDISFDTQLGIGTRFHIDFPEAIAAKAASELKSS